MSKTIYIEIELPEFMENLELEWFESAQIEAKKAVESEVDRIAKSFVKRELKVSYGSK